MADTLTDDVPKQQGNVAGNALNPNTSTEPEVHIKTNEVEADLKTPLLNLRPNANNSKASSPAKACGNGEMSTEEDALINNTENL